MNLQNLDTTQSYAFIERDGQVLCAYGSVQLLDTLNELEKLHESTDKPLIFLNPYSAITEKGYELNEPKLPIRVLIPETHFDISREELLTQLPDETLSFEGDLQTSLEDEAFAALIADMQKNEIEGGNAVQVLMSREFSGQISDFDEDKLLSLFGHLLARRGQYMTFLFVDRSEDDFRYFVGASIEKHLEMTRDTVSMIPICGTYRKQPSPQPLSQRARGLIGFLRDQKEIDELTQVMEEEFKMMAAMCPEGGEIQGPILRESGSVIHTEYHLQGKRTDQEVIPMLRHSLHAPTLMGGPIESSARIIAQYETEARRYYGGQIGVLRKEPMSVLDSAILIRSAEIDSQGHLTVRAGGTITKDSVPMSEAKETRAKADSLLKIFGEYQYCDEMLLNDALLTELEPVLAERNQVLSKFHFKDHSISYPGSVQGLGKDSGQARMTTLKGIRITIIDNEDHFADVKAFMLRLMGAEVEVVDTFEFNCHSERSEESAQADPSVTTFLQDDRVVIIGPGPGDVNDLENPRIRKLHEIIPALKASGTKMLGVCLGLRCCV